jgi:release factor glutamine methyltransferase
MIYKLKRAVEGKRTSLINGFYVITDPVEYDKQDQVFPLHPENQFYLDDIVEEKISGARALEIGIGSGVLSIGAARAGASRVTSLEINPRAKNYAGFNILMNGLEDKVEIRDGDTEDIFKPVQGEKFDYIISNPPFEPTPQGIDYYLHSSGGIYGLDFVERIFQNLDQYLSDEGHAQIVTFAPGNENNPFMLVDLVDKYLSGMTNIRVNPVSMKFDDFVDRFVDIGQATQEQVKQMKEQASQDNVTHLYLCMVHYERGEKCLIVGPTSRVYQNWDLPLDSDVPMGWKEK